MLLKHVVLNIWESIFFDNLFSDKGADLYIMFKNMIIDITDGFFYFILLLWLLLQDLKL